ncbi:MAG: PD-(D/E)XK nuclease family protein [Acidimicrobiales bacterium]
MPLACIASQVGTPVTDALRDSLDTAKSGDPLRRVTVLVPTNYVGLSIRRSLARAGGVAGVDFLTPYRLAELLGAAGLAATGRRPVSTPVVAAAIRKVLGDDPGMFASVIDHPSTERALVRAHRELSDVSGTALSTLAGASRRARDVVRIHLATRDHLAEAWYDEHDLMTSARSVIEQGSPFIAELGKILVYQPLRLSNSVIELLTDLSKASDVAIIVGFTGDPIADQTLADTISRLGIEVTRPTQVTYPRTKEIISTADADDEVRVAVRRVVDAARDGIPLERIAVLYGSDRPYARQLHEQLEAAGIAFNGAAIRSIGEGLLGQTLLRLLALPDREFRRADMFTLLGGAALRDSDGKFVPASAWERVSRDAGIVSGIDQWIFRLEQHLADLELDSDAENRTEGRDWRLAQIKRQQGWTTGLLAFVSELAEDLDPAKIPPTWRAKSAWAQRLIRRYIGGEHTRGAWPAVELSAAEKVEAALERLASLDSVEPNPSLAVFRRTLDLELESALGREGRFGNGVLIGPIANAFGLELDRTIMVGLAEGVYPNHPRDDSLLPDHERRLLAGELALRSDRMADQHRDFLACLAAASQGSVLCFPRGDLRRSTERTASRWLLDTTKALNGSRISGADLSKHRGTAWFSEVPSFAGGLARLDFPATDQEYGLRSLLEHCAVTRNPGDHDLAKTAAGFRNGVALIEARRGPHFTRFDGNLSQLTMPSPADADQQFSPTRLERWADCPHRYLFQSVLRINEIEHPDRQLRISPLDRGNIVHRALDEFMTQMIDDGESPAPGDLWSDQQRRVLRDITDSHCEFYENRGLTGKKLFWERDKRQILRDVDQFLTHDDEKRLGWRSMPYRTELAFGLQEAADPAIVLKLSDGRSLRFVGSIDRVDRGHDGSIVVIDYKTGKKRYFAKLDEDNPVDHGRKLQLPIYGLAARSHLRNPSAGVWTGYWFLNDDSKFATVGYFLTPEILSEFDAVLRTIVDNIEAGVFIARPNIPSSFNKGNCPYCDPDRLGTTERYRQWERKKLAPELDSYRHLIEPETLEL